MIAAVILTEFTDPGCPWAWSAEPFRRRLTWLYGEHIDWRLCMVGLAETPEQYEQTGFTPERQAKAFAQIARDHGMPIDTAERPRMAATVPACRAVIAARLHAPQLERALLRRLRVLGFSGRLIDEPDTLACAARDVGIDPEDVERWSSSDAVEQTLRSDMAEARRPIAAARVLDHKLANWSGGRRYTCPSYEILRISDGVRIAVPGFQPFAAYDVVLANLLPDVERRDPPQSVEEVLRWSSVPLASKEVAVTCDVTFEHAREALGRVAVEQCVGWDGFWSLPSVTSDEAAL